MTNFIQDSLNVVHHKHSRSVSVPPAFGVAQARQVRAFHRTVPEYGETPLVPLRSLARELGLGGLYVKDESYRFGLNAFKALGGTYSMANVLARRLGRPLAELGFADLAGPGARAQLGTMSFVTATDGNHGRGVAWTARQLGQKAVVYMPAGSAAERLENIRRLGAEASIRDGNYDDTVRFAASQAERHGWILVQDTAWEGYTEIPRWIMQGYLTLADEAAEQLPTAPTHIFLQAGVGSMAGAVAAYFSDRCPGAAKPVITVVEPNGADCLFRTAAADDGKLHAVRELHSIMAGLCCGEPCSLAWDLLKDTADYFVSIPDWVAADGMRILGAPLPGDGRIISGESGAATTGFVAELLRNPALRGLRDELGLDGSAQVLCSSTEGATDRENYRKIVWDGAFARITE